jgi:hypothetical protein
MMLIDLSAECFRVLNWLDTLPLDVNSAMPLCNYQAMMWKELSRLGRAASEAHLPGRPKLPDISVFNAGGQEMFVLVDLARDYIIQLRDCARAEWQRRIAETTPVSRGKGTVQRSAASKRGAKEGTSDLEPLAPEPVSVVSGTTA